MRLLARDLIHVNLYKSDGTVVRDIEANLQSNVGKMLTQAMDVKFEEGDIIEHVLPNGIIEAYLITQVNWSPNVISIDIKKSVKNNSKKSVVANVYDVFFKKLLEHSNELGEYVNSLYSGNEYTEDDLNELFGYLKRKGLVRVLFADNRAYEVSITFEGKHYFEGKEDSMTKYPLEVLIDEIDSVKSKFHKTTEMQLDTIHDVPEYMEWKEKVLVELRDIHKRTQDKSVWTAINKLEAPMNGFSDDEDFNGIAAALKAMTSRMDYYYEGSEQKYLPSIKLKQYDVFLSHANQDKLGYVDDLYDAINKLGIHIFYDKEELEWGDNWKDRIINGVQNSEFAIIVISKNFFGCEWTERELDEFLNRQDESGQKIILPLLYDIDIADLRNKYPKVSDIQAISNRDKDVKDVAVLLARQLIKRYKENYNGR